MVKRRVTLGSGLNTQKLADTIKQIIHGGGKPAALICDAQRIDHGWVYLQAIDSGSDDSDGAGWSIKAGYPYSIAPEILCADKDFNLPSGCQFGEWAMEIYATIELPNSIPVDKIAELIQNWMSKIQDVTNKEKVSVSLEYT